MKAKGKASQYRKKHLVRRLWLFLIFRRGFLFFFFFLFFSFEGEKGRGGGEKGEEGGQERKGFFLWEKSGKVGKCENLN